MSKLSPEDYDAIAAAVEAGETMRAVAQRFGVHPSTVSWTCLRLGADVPKERRKAQPARSVAAIRNGRPVRPFTPAEDTTLLAMKAEGTRNVDIARKLGRHHVSVYGRLLTLGRHQARAEENL